MDLLEPVEAENERYAASLLFVHGLWAGPQVWRGFAQGFAHRGWRCLLFDGRSRSSEAIGFEGWRQSVASAAAGLEGPVVVVGHDAGGLIALSLAERGEVAAAVSVAPLLGGVAPLLSLATRLRGRMGLGWADPPDGDHPYRQTASPEARALVDALLAPEPAGRPASLRGRVLAPGAPVVPTLLVAQEADTVVPSALIEITGAGIAAESMSLPGGHWAMLEGRPDPWLMPVHRWLIRRLGPSLLLLRGDEDLVDDEI